MIAEDRPFWWVNETPAYTALTRPTLRQTYLTCETSSGNPSGHVMILAAVLYAAMEESIQTCQWYKTGGNAIRCLTWNTYIFLLALVSISRMYFACHFLHQCVLGAALGVILMKLIRRHQLDGNFFHLSIGKATCVGVLLILITLVIYIAQLLLQKDPQWSIRKVFILIFQ